MTVIRLAQQGTNRDRGGETAEASTVIEKTPRRDSLVNHLSARISQRAVRHHRREFERIIRRAEAARAFNASLADLKERIAQVRESRLSPDYAFRSAHSSVRAA